MYIGPKMWELDPLNKQNLEIVRALKCAIKK